MEQSFGLSVLYAIGVVVWLLFLLLVGLVVWKTEPGLDEESNS